MILQDEKRSTTIIGMAKFDRSKAHKEKINQIANIKHENQVLPDHKNRNS